jgi:hypothetical protein
MEQAAWRPLTDAAMPHTKVSCRNVSPCLTIERSRRSLVGAPKATIDRELLEELIQQRLETAQEKIDIELDEWLRDAWRNCVTVRSLCFPDFADGSGVVEEEIDDDGWAIERPAESADELLDRYTGEWEATFQSGYGRRWQTFGSMFREAAREALCLAAGDCPGGLTDDHWRDAVSEYILGSMWDEDSTQDACRRFNEWLASQRT